MLTVALTYGVFGAVLAVAIGFHLRGHRRRDEAAREASRRVGLGAADGPRAQHPHIDIEACLGCGACVTACPEGEVLGVIAGKAALIEGVKCIGHGLCAEACPVGAIEIVMAPPSMTADLPALTPELESTVPHLFIAGELGGLALIKNAINQGRDCVDRIAERIPALRRRPVLGDNPVDVAIVGAGPAGLAAALRALERGLKYVLFEAEELGGTVAKYPRQKLVMTSPVELPFLGRFSKLEISKEELLATWQKAATKAGLRVRSHERVEAVEVDDVGRFTIRTAKGTTRALAVVMAIGKRGTPRKLGVPGEDRPHVMYSLLDAEAYTGAKIVVVGGGDSAVEAAMGLATQAGNRVVLSYRQAAFSRLKDRNTKRLAAMLDRRELGVLYNSIPVEITAEAVVLDVEGQRQSVPADFVWIFAGGTMPKPFLEKIGIGFGRQDLSAQARAEAGAATAAA